MRLDDIPLKNKLPATMGFALLLTLAVTALFAVAIQEILGACRNLWANEIAMEMQGQEVAVALLQARRAEKDFLLRHDGELVAKVGQQVEKATQAAEKLKALAREGDVRPGETLGQLSAYHQAFLQVAEAWKVKGLTPEQGLQQAFRASARHLEELLDQDGLPEITIRYLTLRRLEKDYLLRNEESYAHKVNQQVGVLRGEVTHAPLPAADQQAILGHLDDYAVSFQALVEQEGRMRVTMEAMRQAAHRVEELAYAMRSASIDQATMATQRTQAFGEKVFYTLTPIAVLAVLLVGALMSSILREILRDLGKLSSYAQQVAEGNLEAETDVVSRDEIGLLAQVMRDMVQQMRAIRVIADRMVFIMVLIGRGTIPERIDGRFPGDLQKICDALNGMITQLGEIRVIADQIHRVREGELPARVDGRFEGDFRKLVEAVNGLIERLREAVTRPPMG